MNTLYPIAKLVDYQVLIVNKSDLPFIGKERRLEVMCIRVDLRAGWIDSIDVLAKHFQANPWEDIIDEEERDAVLREIKSIFSDKDISEKIVVPLAAHMIRGCITCDLALRRYGSSQLWT